MNVRLEILDGDISLSSHEFCEMCFYCWKCGKNKNLSDDLPVKYFTIFFLCEILIWYENLGSVCLIVN